MNLISLARFLCLLPLAAGQDLIALNVYATNAPANALSTVVANAVTYIDILLNAEPSDYIWLEPGEEVPSDSRKLRADDLITTGESEGQSVAVTTSLRGGAADNRELYMYSCPTRCAKSSSSSCKQLGCAYCGTRCRRRARELLLSSGDAALIETTINLLLRPLCFLRLGCSVSAELFRVTWENGTDVQTALT